MKRHLLAGLVHSSFGTEGGDGVIVGHIDFLLFPDDCVKVGGEDVSESSSDYYDVVFLEIGGGSFALLAEAEGESAAGEELPCCDVAHG